MTAASRTRRATINDVARQAGVSVGTVSRYLNGQVLRAGNRDQIERAIEALSFRPSNIARAMKADSTRIIGFLVPEYDEFHARLLEALARLFQSAGYTMLTYCHDDRAEDLGRALEWFTGHRIDALVLAGSPVAERAIAPMIESGTPLIVYNNDILGLNVDRVFVENRRASCRAVAHLMDLGHRRIALIGGSEADTTGQHRREGYEQAHRDRGLSPDPALMIAGNWREQGGYNAIEQLMAMNAPPTAVFCANYRMVTGILEWVREHRRAVPRDFSLVSFDDVELFRLYGDGITAVAQPIDQIARSIVACALARLSGDELAATTSRHLQCNLILRGSTRPPQPREGTHDG